MSRVAAGMGAALRKNFSVKDAFRAKFDALAESQEPLINSASFEHIPIDVHVPVLDVKGLPVKDPNRKLSKAVIQGSFDTSRRNYTAFFSDIIQSLHGESAQEPPCALLTSFGQTILKHGATTHWAIDRLSYQSTNPQILLSSLHWSVRGSCRCQKSWRTWLRYTVG